MVCFFNNYIAEDIRLNCYAIDMFFVECVYSGYKNKITEVRSFKSGWCLDKYATDLNKYFKKILHRIFFN